MKAVQYSTFQKDIEYLQTHNQTFGKSKLLTLNPFLDEKGILRVGGRLALSDLQYEAKHPILLHHHHHITNLIIGDIHRRRYHTGASSTLAGLRERYWITRGKETVTNFIRKCVICVKFHGQVQRQIMCNLPPQRINRTKRPFIYSSVDYFGPVMTKASSGRGKTLTKGYGAIFVCLNTKAVHLELVQFSKG